MSRDVYNTMPGAESVDVPEHAVDCGRHRRRRPYYRVVVAEKVDPELGAPATQERESLPNAPE